MTARLPIIFASLFMLLSAHAYAQNGNNFTLIKDFLKIEKSAQDGFISTSILAIGVVAAQIKPIMAECIDGWYSTDLEQRSQRNNEITQVMQKYPDYFPTGIILAVLEQECGKFDRPNS